MSDLHRSVSWLTGHHLGASPSQTGKPVQWHVTRGLAAYSCGGSRGLEPRSLFTLSREREPDAGVWVSVAVREVKSEHEAADQRAALRAIHSSRD